MNKSFYVNDGLADADSIKEAITLQRQLQELFGRVGFLLLQSPYCPETRS